MTDDINQKKNTTVTFVVNSWPWKVAVNRQKETVERTPNCMRIVMTLRQWAVPWAFLGIEGLVEVTRRNACARGWTT